MSAVPTCLLSLGNKCKKYASKIAKNVANSVLFYRGINVLEKPELQKTFDNRRQTQRAKEWDEQKKSHSKRTSLEMKLEERAHKLKEVVRSLCVRKPTIWVPDQV